MAHEFVEPASDFEEAFRVLLGQDRVGDLVGEGLPVGFGGFEGGGVEGGTVGVGGWVGGEARGS